MRLLPAALGLLLWALAAAPAIARTAPPAEDGRDLQISLLTFGPGSIYWERFGHNAILVRDRRSGTAIAYNYGIFDFNQKNFFLNFARGYMTYRIAADPLGYDLQMYREEGRSVTEQRLNLTPAQRLALDTFLQWNAQPEHAQYRYDYFLSNCSTRVRDALDAALDHHLRRQLQAVAAPPGHSYRFEAVRLIGPDTLMAMAMDIALGPLADRPLSVWQQAFVPMVLSRAMNTATTADGRPLVSADLTLVAGRLPPAPAAPPRWWMGLAAAGLLLAATLWGLSSVTAGWARYGFAALALALSLLSGVGGVILALIWAVTAHWAGWYNENLLLFDPLMLLLIPRWIAIARGRAAPRSRLAILIAALALASIALRLLPGAYQANLQWIALMLPPLLVLALRRPAVRR